MKNLIVLLAEGFEEIEALAPIDVLRRLSLPVILASITDDLLVKGSHGVVIHAEKKLSELNIDDVSAVILPGGLMGSRNLRDTPAVIDFLQSAQQKQLLIAANCAAPTVLDKAGIIGNASYTCYPGFEAEISHGTYCPDARVVAEPQLITACGPGVSLEFAFAIAERFVPKETALALKNGMQISYF